MLIRELINPQSDIDVPNPDSEQQLMCDQLSPDGFFSVRRDVCQRHDVTTLSCQCASC